MHQSQKIIQLHILHQSLLIKHQDANWEMEPQTLEELSYPDTQLEAKINSVQMCPFVTTGIERNEKRITAKDTSPTNKMIAYFQMEYGLTSDTFARN